MFVTVIQLQGKVYALEHVNIYPGMKTQSQQDIDIRVAMQYTIQTHRIVQHSIM